jgi:hypothetical protein
MKIVFKADAGAFVQATDEAERTMAKGLTAAMREVGQKAADAANANIHAAGFASRKWEMRAKNFPASGNTLLPEVWLHSQVNFEDVFTEGKTIVGNPLLWLPLPSVPLWPGDATRQMSPRKYVETVGPLVTMKRPGKTPLLGAPVTGSLRPQPFGRFVTKARLRRGQLGGGAVTLVPLFVGVPAVAVEKRFDVQGAVEHATEAMQGLYIENETP